MIRAINYSLIIASVILLVVFKLCYWKWEYLSGRNAGGLVPFVFLAGSTCAIATNYRLFTAHTLNKLITRLTLITFDLFLLGLFVVPLPQGEWGAIEYNHGFRDLVKNSGDAPAIVTWARQVSVDPKFKDVSYRPKFLRDYGEPEDINVAKDKSVIIMWGGGFFHWGLCVLALDAAPPQTDEYSYYEKIDDDLYAEVPLR